MNAEAGRQGLLLINLGTPEAPDARAVRRYLREFLSDPRVIDIHPVGRWLLLNLFILPFRPSRSAEAYRKIWTREGSPLLVNGRAFARALGDRLRGSFEVELAMRYGHPSIRAGVESLRTRGVNELTVLPLYPQYAASSTASSVDELMRILGQGWDIEPVRVLPPFYDDPDFVDAFAAVARSMLESSRPDYVLFSFHGLPERQIRKSDPTRSHCLSSASCCDAIGWPNHRCYRAQCFATARALAGKLALKPDGWRVSFQSRLGRTPWIRPYTDQVLDELGRRGVKQLAVLVPSFVADCLETLEEIGIRGAETFRQAGGESLTLVPSLNAHPAWVEAVVRMVRRGALHAEPRARHDDAENPSPDGIASHHPSN
ncbi:MAG TPA: ferrochelatase [Myxococcaceae bacterium]|nr:ferrochelatase [Myxococcaceae bacterium]